MERNKSNNLQVKFGLNQGVGPCIVIAIMPLLEVRNLVKIYSTDEGIFG